MSLYEYQFHMLEVLPSINHPDAVELKRRIRLVEPYVPWVHLDVSDGIFGSVKVFDDPSPFYDFQTPASIEAHLMIAKPEENLDDWLHAGVKRFVIHVESTADFGALAHRIRAADREVAMALKIETDIEAYRPFSAEVHRVLVLGVNPGPSGQMMDPGTVEKVMRLRTAFPSCIIEVDGGVSLPLGTAKKCADAGANALVSGHDIFSSNDIRKTVRELSNLL